MHPECAWPKRNESIFATKPTQRKRGAILKTGNSVQNADVISHDEPIQFSAMRINVHCSRACDPPLFNSTLALVSAIIY